MTLRELYPAARFHASAFRSIRILLIRIWDSGVGVKALRFIYHGISY